MNEPNHYSLRGSAVEIYEGRIVPGVMAPFAQGLIEFADLKVGEKVVDVGCGTGVLARLAWPLVAPSGEVIGIDLSAQMLEVARRRAEEQGLRISWERGDAAALPASDQRFDVVLCQHGLQYFPNRLGALLEMRRVLRPSGRVALNVWRPVENNSGHAVFADALERRVSSAAATERRAPFALSDRSELRKLLIEAGFASIVIRLDTRIARFPSAEAMVRIMMAGSPLAAVMSDADPTVLQMVVAEVTEGLSKYQDDIGLALPMQAWVATARA